MRYSGLADPERWVLPAVLLAQADETPDALWIRMVDGDGLTFAEAAMDARRVAGWLAGLGVAPGERVAVMAANSLDFVRAWMGLGMLGAVAVLLNTELCGPFLAHQLAQSDATLVIVDAALADTVDAVALPGLRRMAIIGTLESESQKRGAPELLAFGAWRDAAPFAGALPAARDIAAVMFTSGTSGPAKGVLMPHAHCTLYGIGALRAFEVRDDDRWYICLPLFHSNGLLMQLGTTLLAGIPAIVRPRFSASAWLDDIRAHGATLTNLLGVLASFVLAQPARADDRAHRLRAVLNGPNLPDVEAALRDRFGIGDVLTGFGMTETNVPIWGRVGLRTGEAGLIDERHFDVVVADPDSDRALPSGAVGEILVRPKVPFGFMAGYLGDPEATARAWRNLWFHTGDAGRADGDGRIAFVCRLGERIRRRGENIAAPEIEAVFLALDGVAEAGACAVPSPVRGGEDEILVAIVGRTDATLDLGRLAAASDAVLPKFARVRFLAEVDSLPKTASGKLRREALRTHLDAAMDREGTR